MEDDGGAARVLQVAGDMVCGGEIAHIGVDKRRFGVVSRAGGEVVFVALGVLVVSPGALHAASIGRLDAFGHRVLVIGKVHLAEAAMDAKRIVGAVPRHVVFLRPAVAVGAAAEDKPVLLRNDGEHVGFGKVHHPTGAFDICLFGRPLVGIERRRVDRVLDGSGVSQDRCGDRKDQYCDVFHGEDLYTTRSMRHVLAPGIRRRG